MVSRQAPLSQLLCASALLGFSIGLALWLSLNLAVFIIEGPEPYYVGTLYFIVMALMSGIVWTIICAVSFPLIWKALHVSAAVWPTLARAALMAFTLQTLTFFTYYFVISHYHLRPWIDTHINDTVWGAVVVFVGIAPALLAACLMLWFAKYSADSGSRHLVTWGVAVGVIGVILALYGLPFTTVPEWTGLLFFVGLLLILIALILIILGVIKYAVWRLRGAESRTRKSAARPQR